jgi:hypothetical protein
MENDDYDVLAKVRRACEGWRALSTAVRQRKTPAPNGPGSLAGWGWGLGRHSTRRFVQSTPGAPPRFLSAKYFRRHRQPVRYAEEAPIEQAIERGEPVSKRLSPPYVSGRSRHWVNSKNPAAPVKRKEEEDWGLIKTPKSAVKKAPRRCSAGPIRLVPEWFVIVFVHSFVVRAVAPVPIR